MMTLSSDLLVLDGVDLAFGGVRALCGVDLAVAEGHTHAIIGPNGAGKSSLLNVISGLYRPDAGAITFAGERFAAMPLGDVARLGIARTFQNLALFPKMNVLENVVMGRTARARATFVENVLGLPRSRSEERENRERASAVVAFLNLQNVAHRLVGTLPYGLQKRVELGRALIAEPRLLLLDEPMAGMTAGEKVEMCRFIVDAKRAFRTTVVLIEHDVGIVMDLADRVVVLDYGRKIADGPPDVIRNDSAVIDAYIGVVHDERLEATAV